MKKLIVYDDPARMQWVAKLGSEKVYLSYEMMFLLRRMIEDRVLERVNEQIRTLADDCRGH